jgi:predicted nucleic acid-binding protein
MKEKKKIYYIDTCFLIHLLLTDSPFNTQAEEFYKRLSEKEDIILKISTIAIAEYAIKGDVTDIPANIHVQSFNVLHAIKAGEFGRVCAQSRKEANDGSNRTIVLNDSKMLAQAEVEEADGFITTDHKAKKVYDILKDKGLVSFEFIDITTTTCANFFGELDF